MNRITKRIANLGMYDWPETEEALDRLWYSIQKKLNSSDISSPRELHRTDDLMSVWKDPNLLLGYTCGWPYANLFREYCIPFARIHYDIEDCPPGYYNCVYIGQSKRDIKYLENRDSLLSAKKIAINSDNSQSGFHVYREITKVPSKIGIPEEKRLVTGAHRASIAAVANGDAQLAAIDTVCFELAKRHDPNLIKNVAVLGRSIPTPGAALITSSLHVSLIPALLEATAFGIYNLSDEDKETLLIKGIEPARDADYDIYG